MSRFEFEDELLRDGFTSMPNTVLYYSGISMGAKATYLVLLSYAWKEMRAWPGQETMANQLGIGVRTIRNYLKELEAHGIIRVKQRGLSMTSDVTFLRLGHLRAAKSAVQGRQAPRTVRAAESARPERRRLPTKNDKRNTTPADITTGEDAPALWAAAQTKLQAELGPGPYREYVASTRALRIEDGELVVACSATQRRVLGGVEYPRVRRALGGRAVRFEVG